MPRKQTVFLLCLKNVGFKAALEPRKVYRSIPDAAAEARGFVRIVDESGEDYLYPSNRFTQIDLPAVAKKTFARAS